MKVYLKCFSTLVDPGTCNFKEATVYDMAPGQTVKDLVQSAGMVPKAIKIAFVNSRKVALESVLNDGDRVGLSPAVGGM